MAKPTNESRIKALEDEVAQLKEQLAAKPAIEITQTPVTTSDTIEKFESQYPVPVEFQEAVMATFNEKFAVTVTPKSDSPEFLFTIIVPDKYSPLTLEQRKNIGGADIRTKVVTYAEGISGVRDYVNKVFNSFNPEVRALILADKGR